MIGNSEHPRLGIFSCLCWKRKISHKQVHYSSRSNPQGKEDGTVKWLKSQSWQKWKESSKHIWLQKHSYTVGKASLLGQESYCEKDWATPKTVDIC